MESFPKDVIALCQYLLPGFLAAWVFYGFTAFPKPSQFERIIQALIFTLIIQLSVFMEKSLALTIGNYLSIGNWTYRSELGCSTVTALIVGALFVHFTQNDRFYHLIRGIGLSRATSYPSEWYGAFRDNVTYVVLHFRDERRLYGWPLAWPTDPDKGHFVLMQASWLDEDKEIPITGVSSLLINVKDIKWVEFMARTQEVNDEQKKHQSTTTP